MSEQGAGGAFEISSRMTALIGWAATVDFTEQWVCTRGNACLCSFALLCPFHLFIPLIRHCDPFSNSKTFALHDSFIQGLRWSSGHVRSRR